MEIKRMEPLFKNEAEYTEFTVRHNKDTVKKGDLSTYSGKCFLGIDSGSTTTKAAVVGAKNQYFHRFLFIVTDAKIINAGL